MIAAASPFGIFGQRIPRRTWNSSSVRMSPNLNGRVRVVCGAQTVPHEKPHNLPLCDRGRTRADGLQPHHFDES
jgi:hypothetical protein